MTVQHPEPGSFQARPRFHFTAPKNWLNDPNGLVYLDGVYHLFYQHNPFANEFGVMHWGHATSEDLVTWEHHPIALAPDGLGQIYSGSAVVDRLNTAGFGPGAIVAVFTHHLETGVESQSIAFSTDGGYTFEKYAGNPVLPQPDDTPDFRDPRVLWWQEGDRGHWVMVLAVGLSIWVYVSDNLIDWRRASRFTPDLDATGAFECPDLAKIRVTGTDEHKWLMTVGVSTGDFSGTRYWIGEFDGIEFAADEPAQWCDYGADFYAVQSWTAAPDDRHIWIGWMNSWSYARDGLTEGWSGVMTIPRDVGIVNTTEGYRLTQAPIRELANSRRDLLRTGPLRLPPDDDPLAGVQGSVFDLAIHISLGESTASQLQLAVRVGEDEATNIEVDLEDLTLTVDRFRSGRHLLHRSYAGPGLVSIAGTGGTLDLRVLVDSTSVEVFAAGGLEAITQQILPDTASVGLSLEAVGGVAAIESMDVYEIVTGGA